MSEVTFFYLQLSLYYLFRKMPKRDRNDRINLDDWNQKPSSSSGSMDKGSDESLANLKQKMAEKEKEAQKEEFKKRWSAMARNMEEQQEVYKYWLD